jgi:SAM-dependent methyltransferase
MSEPVYRPEIFNPSSVDDARRIILTPEPGLSTDERWDRETPYLADRLVETMMPDESSLVLDFGCGIGRLAKAVIERSGCTVIGVDISARMRAYAHI